MTVSTWFLFGCFIAASGIEVCDENGSCSSSEFENTELMQMPSDENSSEPVVEDSTDEDESDEESGDFKPGPKRFIVDKTAEEGARLAWERRQPATQFIQDDQGIKYEHAEQDFADVDMSEYETPEALLALGDSDGDTQLSLSELEHRLLKVYGFKALWRFKSKGGYLEKLERMFFDADTDKSHTLSAAEMHAHPDFREQVTLIQRFEHSDEQDEDDGLQAGETFIAGNEDDYLDEDDEWIKKFLKEELKLPTEKDFLTGNKEFEDPGHWEDPYLKYYPTIYDPSENETMLHLDPKVMEDIEARSKEWFELDRKAKENYRAQYKGGELKQESQTPQRKSGARQGEKETRQPRKQQERETLLVEQTDKLDSDDNDDEIAESLASILSGELDPEDDEDDDDVVEDDDEV